MNKTLWTTMAALALVGVASTALPAASACAATDYVVNTVCNPGPALESGPDGIVDGLIGEAYDTVHNAVRDLLQP